MISGRKQPKRIVFLDRDGVINRNPPPHEYVARPEDLILNPGIAPLLRRLRADGFEFIVVTNQRGVARGLFSEKTLAKIHARMRELLKAHDIELLDIFYCPHEENACDCRKPKDGLLRQAARKYPVDLSASLLISDSAADIEMARRFGLSQALLVPQDRPEEALRAYARPKIRIAFVKFGGLSAGGTEKFLQIIAANLNKDEFAADYYYCDSAPYIGAPHRHPDTDPHRVAYMEARGMNLIKFSVGAKDLTTPTHIWRDTDFWEKFDERNYDIIQAGRGGHKEYPFTRIRRTPIVDSIHLSAGVDNQYNIARVMHLCRSSIDRWARKGGDAARAVLVSLPLEMPAAPPGDLREALGLRDRFVFGMHQRPDNHIFSPLPLQAYKLVEDESTAFVILGGGDAYRKEAEELGIKHIHFLPPTGDLLAICTFLNTLDVYAHGRRDGEVNSQAMAEAMYFGLPIVSHPSPVNNGHLECIGEAGTVHETPEAYAAELRRLRADRAYYAYRREAARQRFAERYELKGQIRRFEEIYREVHADPFPRPLRRRLTALHWTQNLRVWLKWPYLKLKYVLGATV